MKEVGEMLREGLENAGYSVSGIAAETNYSADAWYKAFKGERNIPRDAKPKVAEIDPKAGLAVALEVTGYNIFKQVPGDRHPLANLLRLLKEDQEADDAVRPLMVALIDKLRPEDLGPEDRRNLECASKELLDLARVIMDTVFDWNSRFRLGLTEVLLKKERTA